MYFIVDHSTEPNWHVLGTSQIMTDPNKGCWPANVSQIFTRAVEREPFGRVHMKFNKESSGSNYNSLKVAKCFIT